VLAVGCDQALGWFQSDLETLRAQGDGVAPAVVDYKVKVTPLTREKAEYDAQAGPYIAERWLEDDPRANSASPRSPSPARGASR
jgi:hypothetical protein